MNDLVEVTLEQVLQPNFVRISEDTFILGTILSIKKYDQKPLTLYRTNPLSKFRKNMNDTTYDRMIILGAQNSKNCFVLILESSSMSAKILNVVGLRLGSIVEVQEPIYSNTCLGNDRNNPILTTTKELQPHSVLPNNEHGIPIISNPNSTAIFHFRLRHEKVIFVQTQIISPTCSGILCDRRQAKVDGVCACVQKSPISAWTIQSKLIAENEANESLNQLLDGSTIQSQRLAEFFVSKGTLRLAATSINERRLRACVKTIQAYVNENNGWTLSGYHKSGVSDENIAQNVANIRICSLVPSVDIPESMKYSSAAPVVRNVQNSPSNDS